MLRKLLQIWKFGLMILNIIFSPLKIIATFRDAYKMTEKDMSVAKPQVWLIHPYVGETENEHLESNPLFMGYIEFIARLLVNNWENISAVCFSGPMINNGGNKDKTEGEVMQEFLSKELKAKGIGINLYHSWKVFKTTLQGRCASEWDIRYFLVHLVEKLIALDLTIDICQYKYVQVCDKPHARKCRRIFRLVFGLKPKQEVTQVISDAEKIRHFIISDPLSWLGVVFPSLENIKGAYRKNFDGIG